MDTDRIADGAKDPTSRRSDSVSCLGRGSFQRRHDGVAHSAGCGCGPENRERTRTWGEALIGRKLNYIGSTGCCKALMNLDSAKRRCL